MDADGSSQRRATVTGTLGLRGVGAAIDALDDPEQHTKILIDPQSSVTTV